MDSQVTQIPGLTPNDLDLLHRIEGGLAITADVSRADVLLCTILTRDQALVAHHAIPSSISSLYRKDATGRVFQADEQPLLFQALRSGSGGRRQREVLSNGAPVIQDVYPIYSGEERVIAALVVETNMIAHERQRRRNRNFRQAVIWLQEMAARGELENAANIGRFSLYDGIYLVDANRKIVYMSGIAANLFRSAGIVPDVRDQPLGALETQDVTLVEHVFAVHQCQELRNEAEDGRIWVRMAIPLHAPAAGRRMAWLPRRTRLLGGEGLASDAVLVLLHNATEAVQKQRELNVKSAIIQEVHHRVKNNLQNIAAILRIQARRVESPEARQHLNDAVNRVMSMSVIHEFLSQDEDRTINVRDVCQRIATQVKQVAVDPEQEIAIQVVGSGIRLPASQATPAALVINELILNAVEHGLRDRRQGAITITLTDLGDAVHLVVEDDGIGLPPDFDPGQRQSSLGLQIVQTLVTDDLKGAFRMESVTQAATGAGENGAARAEPRTGARAVVTFPKRNPRLD